MLLIVIAETFEFQNGTLHFAPGLPYAVGNRTKVKVGDPLELRRPNGTVVRTKLHSIDILMPSHGQMGLCVDKPVTKADVPAGTEVWTVDE